MSKTQLAADAIIHPTFKKAKVPTRKETRQDYAVRLLRADPKDASKAERLRKAKRHSGEYGQFWLDDMMSAVRRLLEPKRKKPSTRQMSRDWMVPYESLRRLICKANCTGVFAPGQPNYTGRTYAWNDDELYSVKAGKQPIVPPQIDDRISKLFSVGQKIGQCYGISAAGAILLAELEVNNIPYPDGWDVTGTPGADWWRRFFERHTHLSQGYARMIDEARLSAHSEKAIRDWCKRILEPSGNGWLGLEPDAMEKYLNEQMGDYIKESDMTPEQVRARAKALCHDPRLQSCFDQKGHALGGGSHAVKLVGTKGSRKECADVPDGRWISICPLVFGDGKLGFCTFVVQGNIPIEKEEEEEAPSVSPPVSPVAGPPPVQLPAPPGARFDVNATARNLAHDDTTADGKRKADECKSLGQIFWGGEDTIFASTKSGYSNGEVHLRQWQLGIERLKKAEPWRFPFICWMDNWSGHHTEEFTEWARKTGIILLFFRSHATMWACPLDNGSFGKYEKVYNSEIIKQRKLHKRTLNKGAAMKHVPFWRYMMAVKKACDAAFEEEEIKGSFLRTIFKELEGATSTIEGGGGEMPALVIDADTIVGRVHRVMREQVEHTGAGRDVARAKRHERQQGYNDTILEQSEALMDEVEMARASVVPRGVEPVMIETGEDAGKYLCFNCRAACEAAENNKANEKWHGGCANTSEDAKIRAERREEKEQEQQEKQERAEERDTLNEILGRDMPPEDQVKELTDAIAGVTRVGRPVVAMARDRVTELQKELKEQKAAEKKAAADKKAKAAAHKKRLLAEDLDDRKEWREEKLKQLMGVKGSTEAKRRKAFMKIMKMMEADIAAKDWD